MCNFSFNNLTINFPTVLSKLNNFYRLSTYIIQLNIISKVNLSIVQVF